MLSCTGHVGQDILWQTRTTCQMLVDTGGRQHTKCHSRHHGLCLACYTDCRALEREAEQENKDQIIHRLLHGLAVLRS